MKEIAKAIGIMILSVVLTFVIYVLSIAISGAIGYLLGMAFLLLPMIPEILTEHLPLTRQQIPGLFAWVGVIFTMISVSIKTAKTNDKEDE